MFSIAASTIKSQSVQISFTPVVIFAKIASAAACSIFPLATRFSKPFAILAFPFAANSSLISHKHTSKNYRISVKKMLSLLQIHLL